MSEGANLNESSEFPDDAQLEERVIVEELNNTMGGISNITNSAGLLTPIKGPTLHNYTREQVRAFLEENKRYVAIVNARNGFEIVPIRYRIDVEIRLCSPPRLCPNSVHQLDSHDSRTARRQLSETPVNTRGLPGWKQ